MGSTPGPWEVDSDGYIYPVDHQGLGEDSPYGGYPHIAKVNPAVDSVQGAEVVGSFEGNKRLLVHAPELWEAAKEIQALMNNLWEAVPWGDTFNLDVKRLNEAPLKLDRVLAKIEEG